MTAKEYLMQVKSLNNLIKAKQEELKQLREKAISISSPQWTDKVQSNGENKSMHIIDKIEILENKIRNEMNTLLDLQNEVQDKIEKVYNPDFIALLTDKYINGLTLEKIAEKTGRSYVTICEWHGQALNIFRKENGMI